MCEFCIKHGEGKKWYENMANYSEEVFHQVNSAEQLRKYLSNFYNSIKQGPAEAYKWKKRFPRTYKWIVYPFITKHLKKTHFGQMIPLEDAENIVTHLPFVVRLPCICRKVTIAQEKRYCFGVGMDLSPVFRDVPDFSNFERLTVEEARAYIRFLDTEGNTHSVWTFNTPFIAALCNCDRDCMAYRFQIKMEVGKIMWKGEYVADIDPSLCDGCRECMKRCYFGAITFDRKNMKCSIKLVNCYGCGICRVVCKQNAIVLLDRAGVASVAHAW